MHIHHAPPPTPSFVRTMTAQLHQRIGTVYQDPDDQRCYLVVDHAGQYGTVDLATGQTLFPDTLDWLWHADVDATWYTDLTLHPPTLD